MRVTPLTVSPILQKLLSSQQLKIKKETERGGSFDQVLNQIRSQNQGQAPFFLNISNDIKVIQEAMISGKTLSTADLLL